MLLMSLTLAQVLLSELDDSAREAMDMFQAVCCHELAQVCGSDA